MKNVPQNVFFLILGLFMSGVVRAADSSVMQPPSAAVGGPGAVHIPLEMTLFVGDSRVFDLRTVRVAVGNGKIVSVSPIGGQQLVFIGQSIGSTVVQFWLRGGGLQRMTVTVVANDLVATLSAVNELLHDARGVTAALRGSRVVLEGDAADSRARERAASVAAMFPGTVVDFVAKPGWEVMVHVDVRIVEFRRGASGRMLARNVVAPAPVEEPTIEMLEVTEASGPSSGAHLVVEEVGIDIEPRGRCGRGTVRVAGTARSLTVQPSATAGVESRGYCPPFHLRADH